MKLIVGLGNPGREYAHSRHNAGWMVLDLLIERVSSGAAGRTKFHGMCWEGTVGGERSLLIKPTTYMNRSGLCVSEAVRFYKVALEYLLIVVDETALSTGSIRVRASGGSGGHNGLADVERALGTSAYSRLRIGVDGPPAGEVLADYVLGRFSVEQRDALGPALTRGAEAVEFWAREGVEATMNRFNSKDGSE